MKNGAVITGLDGVFPEFLKTESFLPAVRNSMVQLIVPGGVYG